MIPSLPITLENVRDWFPAPRTENPLVGEPWWQLRGLGLFVALQILRTVPDVPLRQVALIEWRRSLDAAILTVPEPDQDEVRRVMARTLAPYVESDPIVIAGMLDLAGVGPGDTVYDLGSGDGRIVFQARLRGAAGVGIEIDQTFVDKATATAARFNLDRVRFRCEDALTADLADATVITCYLVRASMAALEATFRTLKPGTRIVSHAFAMPNWEPTRVVVVGGATIYLWIVGQ